MTIEKRKGWMKGIISMRERLNLTADEILMSEAMHILNMGRVKIFKLVEKGKLTLKKVPMPYGHVPYSAVFNRNEVKQLKENIENEKIAIAERKAQKKLAFEEKKKQREEKKKQREENKKNFTSGKNNLLNKLNQNKHKNVEHKLIFAEVSKEEFNEIDVLAFRKKVPIYNMTYELILIGLKAYKLTN